MTQVTFHTSMGDIKIEVDHENAPLTAENFVKYAEEGFYNGTIFHRIIPSFVVQGGGLVAGMEEKPNRDSIKNEADNGLKNLKGSLSMARTMDPNSATSQFFINLKDNDFLDHTTKMCMVGVMPFLPRLWKVWRSFKPWPRLKPPTAKAIKMCQEKTLPLKTPRFKRYNAFG